MRISDLAARSGTTATTIKWYVSEGLVPAGERVGYNQTDYTDLHLQRLRLVRSLMQVGGLSLAAVKGVLAAADDPDHSFGDVLGVAHASLPQRTSPPSEESVRHVRDAALARGWTVPDDNPGLPAAAAVIDQYRALGREDLSAALDGYLRAAEIVAAADLDTVTTSLDQGPATATQTVVVGTVLGDALFAGLRRMAQTHESIRRFGPTDPGSPS